MAAAPDPTTKLRYEMKFWASEAQAAALVRVARQHMDFDPHCRDGAQRNVSLYFDSPNLTFFHLHLSGAPDRSKLRIRTYDDPTAPAFLEVKRRIKGMTTKHRAVVSRQVAQAIAAGRYDIIRELPPNPDLARFVFMCQLYMVSPIILVAARRLALSGLEDGGNFRLTLDRDIRYQAPSGSSLTGRTGGWTPVDLVERSGDGAMTVLIEMKFREAAPAWLAPVISLLGLQHTSFSKYVACLGQDQAENGDLSSLRSDGFFEDWEVE